MRNCYFDNNIFSLFCSLYGVSSATGIEVYISWWVYENTAFNPFVLLIDCGVCDLN